MNTTEIIMPIRSAQTQFETAGADSTSIRETADNNFVQVDGVGGPCYMRVAEYQKYTRMRADWISAGTDQHDAPDPAMMLMATQEEVVELEEEQCRPRSYFRESFKEIELLLLSYNHTLSEEERDEIILTLCAKLLPLREAVLRAEEIWEEDSKHAEDRHREDIEKLACINQNESLIAIAKELERELNATVGTLQLVWPFLHEDDGHGANAPAYQNAIDAVKAILAVKKGGQP